MASYFTKADGKTLEIPSDCAFSAGNTCETRERRMWDGSKSPQAITTFRRAEASTYSLQFEVHQYGETVQDVMSAVYQWEALAGQSLELVYCDIPFGKVIVESVNISLTTDGANGISGAAIGFSLRENRIVDRISTLNVRFE